MAVDEDGVTIRSHLEAVQKQTKRKPPELDYKPIDQNIKYILSKFFLIRAETNSENPISARSFLDHQELYKIVFSKFEIESIKKLDRIWRVSQNG